MDGVGVRRRLVTACAVASWVLLSITALPTPDDRSAPPAALDGLWSEDFGDCSLDRVYTAYDDHDSGSSANYGDIVDVVVVRSTCAVRVRAVSDNGFNHVPITPRAFVSSPYIDDWDTSREYNVSFRATVYRTDVTPQRLVLMGTVDFRLLYTEGKGTVINSSEGEFELPYVPPPNVEPPPPLIAIDVAKPASAPPTCHVWADSTSLGAYPCGGTDLELRTLFFGDLGDESGFVNNKGEGVWDDLSLKYTKDTSAAPLAVDAGPDLAVDEGQPVTLRATASGGGAARYWDQHTFGFDIVVGSAPAGSWVTEYTLGGTLQPGIVAVTYGAGRAAFGPDDGLTGGGPIGGINHQIYVNSVLWASQRDRPEDARALVVWGHKDVLFYHSGSRNLVGALRVEGFRVDVRQDVPSDLSAYDVVVLAAVGWDWAGFSQQGVDLGYCSIASAGCPAGPGLSTAEVDAVLAFVQAGGGLVASAERDSGDNYLNPVSQPMGVTFADLTSGGHTAVKVADHPILRRWGSAGGPPYTFRWDLNDFVDRDGDGDPRNDADAVGESVDAVYGDDGAYRATVVVTDSTGATATDTVEVRVGNVPPKVQVLVSATATVNVTLRVAGEKWHDVNLTLSRGGAVVATASIVRVPGSPDDQAVTVHGVSIDLLGEAASAVVVYTPMDDPVNGQVNGANPAWLILTTVDGTEVRAHHTFNVRHPDTWTWTVTDLRALLGGVPIRFEASATDPGSDDLTFAWDWGDGTPVTTSLYFNNGVSPDPPSSPDVGPMAATDVQVHAFLTSADILVRLTVTDDDGGLTGFLIDLTP